MLSLNKRFKTKKVRHKTDKGNSEYYENLLHNSRSWQSQRLDMTRNNLEQLGRQGTDRADDIATTTSAQVFGRLLIRVTRRPETRSDTTRVFHRIYATTTS